MHRVLGDDPLTRRRKDARATGRQDVFFARAGSSEFIQQESPVVDSATPAESQAGTSLVAVTVQADSVSVSQASDAPSAPATSVDAPQDAPASPSSVSDVAPQDAPASTPAAVDSGPQVREEQASQSGGFLGRIFGRFRR